MDALISGKAGLAALITGDEASLISYNGDVKKESSYDSIARQFSLYDDTLYLATTDHSSTLKTLKFESDKSDAILIILTILDESIPQESKHELIRISDDILSRPAVLSHVCGVMHSRPLDDNAITDISSLSTGNHSTTLLLINNLIVSQERINTVYEIWRNAAISFQTSENDLRYIEGIFVNNQIGYYFSSATINKTQFGKIKFSCLNQLQGIKNSRQILNKLFSSIEINITNDTSTSSNQFLSESNNTANTTPSRKKPIKIHETYQQVSSQIKGVKKLLEKGDRQRALRFAEDLIKSQSQRGENNYASMSLCQLSEIAKNIGDYSLQLEWAKRATEANPKDARAYAHAADAYLNLGQLEKAQQNFQLSVDFGNLTFGKSGLARIERSRYNYDLALDLVNEAIQVQPEYQSLWLKAELYRDSHQLNEALDLYKHLMKEYPEEASAMCGYAAVLAEQGELNKAESTYRDIINLYPSDQVPATGLGFLLARQGRHKEAIKYLDLGVQKRSKGDYISFLAKAKALQIRGDTKGAEDIYFTVIKINKYLPDPWLELIEMHANSRMFETARNFLHKAKTIFPHNDQLLLSEAQILKNEENYIASLEILDTLRASHPRWLKVLTARANTLKELSYLKDARDQYLEILSFNEYSSRAKLGIQILDALEGSGVTQAGTQQPKHDLNEMLVEDWEEMHINGLLLLASNNLNEAKITLLQGYKKSPFKPMKEKFAVSLAVVRNSMGQHATALTSIKNINTPHALMQKIITKGELGQQKEMKDNLKSLLEIQPNHRDRKVINLLEARYLKNIALKKKKPELSVIMSEELRSILLAA